MIPDRLRESPLPTEGQKLDRLYRQALSESGFGHLLPWLEAGNETRFLQAIKNEASHLPLRGWVEVPESQIRLRRVSPENLFGIYGRAPEKRPGPVELTAVGRRLWAVLKENPSLSFFLIDGTAYESTGEKPSSTRRLLPARSQFAPELVKWGSSRYGGAAPPEVDIDLLMVTADPQIDEETIRNSLNRGRLGRTYAYIKVIRATTRPDFKRIDIQTSKNLYQPDQPERISLGQLAFPEDITGQYASYLRLIKAVMSRPNSPPPVLLVPSGDEVNPACIGVAIDFFPGRAKHRWIQIYLEGVEKSLRPLVFPWPDFAFPKFSLVESFAHFTAQFRTWPWTDSLPLMEINPPGEISYRLEEALREPDRFVVNKFSRRTAHWLAENIVYPVSQHPERLGTAEQRLYASKNFMVALVKSFDGSPHLTLIRCLWEEYRRSGIPAWGMGIFSEKGLYPELGRFLSEDERLPRLLELMRKKSTDQNRQGWKAFVGFLLAEARNDADVVRRLLTPQIMTGLSQNYQIRYSEILKEVADDRIIPLSSPTAAERREANLARLVAIILEASKPLTTNQVLHSAGLGQHGRKFLKDLASQGLIIELGHPPGGSVDQIRRPKISYWANPQKQPEFAHYLSPSTRVLDAVREGASTIPEIMSQTELAKHAIEYALRCLRKEGLISTERVRQGKSFYLSVVVTESENPSS